MKPQQKAFLDQNIYWIDIIQISLGCQISGDILVLETASCFMRSKIGIKNSVYLFCMFQQNNKFLKFTKTQFHFDKFLVDI